MTENESSLQSLLDALAQMQGEITALQTVLRLCIDVLSIGDPQTFGTLRSRISGMSEDYRLNAKEGLLDNRTPMFAAFVAMLSKIGENGPTEPHLPFRVFEGGKDTPPP